MISLRKRGAVYGVIGLMLCVAVYLNWSYFQTPDELTIADQAEASGSVYGAVTAVDNTDTAADASSDGSAKKTQKTDYFAQARLSRETARDEALTMLRETVSDDSASEDAKKQASEKITQIAGNTVKEERLGKPAQIQGIHRRGRLYLRGDNQRHCFFAKGRSECFIYSGNFGYGIV